MSCAENTDNESSALPDAALLRTVGPPPIVGARKDGSGDKLKIESRTGVDRPALVEVIRSGGRPTSISCELFPRMSWKTISIEVVAYKADIQHKSRKGATEGVRQFEVIEVAGHAVPKT